MAFSTQQFAMIQGMNAHNKLIRESVVRIHATGTDCLGNKRRLLVHDHPERGLIYSLATACGTPLYIERSQLLPNNWSDAAPQQICEHFKTHNYTTFSV
jgi:hypothetical protein